MTVDYKTIENIVEENFPNTVLFHDMTDTAIYTRQPNVKRPFSFLFDKKRFKIFLVRSALVCCVCDM